MIPLVCLAPIERDTPMEHFVLKIKNTAIDNDWFTKDEILPLDLLAIK